VQAKHWGVVFDLETAVKVSRPAHVLVLLLKTAVEAKVKAAVKVEVEVEASRPRYYYQ
jgi:hypothetical protein